MPKKARQRGREAAEQPGHWADGQPYSRTAGAAEEARAARCCPRLPLAARGGRRRAKAAEGCQGNGGASQLSDCEVPIIHLGQGYMKGSSNRVPELSSAKQA